MHLLKVCLLVEVGRHDLGQEGLQHIGKEEQQQAAQQPSQGLEHMSDMLIGVALAEEAAHKDRNQQGHPQKSPQRFLHSTSDVTDCL